MKKALRNITIVALLSIMVVLLTGCGGNKIVATKTNEDEGYGNYEEKLEITFKNDEIDNVKMIMEFEDEEKATSLFGLFSLATSMSEEDLGFDVKQNGKKVEMQMSAEAYKEQEGYDAEEMSKEAIIKSLEEDGYTVK